MCQIVGRPNQMVPPTPFHPVPAIGDPFGHIIVDCVGPLPKSKVGNQYLFTVMCATPRYPEAFPRLRITASAVVRAYIRVRFFSMFGLPKVLKSDQGTNFMLFYQVLQQLAKLCYLHSLPP